MEFILDYGLFLAKTVTIAAAVLFIAVSVLTISTRQRARGRDGIEVTKLNDKFEHMKHSIESMSLPKELLKRARKERRQERKRLGKSKTRDRNRVFVINFDGDLRGHNVANLREEITAVLTLATARDLVVVRIESAGGVVHAHGLGASQLDRVRARGIPLTVCVDKIAASGGYLMACVADRIVAAPFAVVGSIGVLAQLPNFNKTLKKHDIEFEQITAGEYKRTLTLFGENTDKAREKMRRDVEEIHDLFKDFVGRHRSRLDLERVATGEHWLGTKALELGLVDELQTSDDLLLEASNDSDVLEISYKGKRNLLQRIASNAARLGAWLKTRSDPGQSPYMLT